MKRLVLMALGIAILLVPATSDAGRRIKMCDFDNASMLCFELEDLGGRYFPYDSHGDCVSDYQPYFNEKCGNGNAKDIAEACKFYMRCEEDGYCAADDWKCEIACWFVHLFDPPCDYWYNNVGQCVSDFRANSD